MKSESESAIHGGDMPDTQTHSAATDEADVYFGRFTLAWLGQLATVLAVYWLIAPGMLRSELDRRWAILLWTVGLGLPLSLFEYLYHRYLLHSAVLPFMSAMQRAHGTHHR